MRQLLEYGMRRARQYPDDAPELGPEALLKEAEVRKFLSCFTIVMFNDSDDSSIRHLYKN